MTTIKLVIETLHVRGNETVILKFPANYGIEGDYFGIVVTSTDQSGPGEGFEVLSVFTELFIQPWNQQHVRVLAPILPLPLIEEIRRRSRHEPSFEVEVDSHVFQLFIDDMRRMMSM